MQHAHQAHKHECNAGWHEGSKTSRCLSCKLCTCSILLCSAISIMRLCASVTVGQQQASQAAETYVLALMQRKLMTELMHIIIVQ
jgi:hypothetical protein